MSAEKRQGIEIGQASLQNPKYEAFATFVASGLRVETSYKQAGFQSKTEGAARASGYKLLRRAEVQQRIAYLKGGTQSGVTNELGGVVAEKIRDRTERLQGLEDLRRRIHIIIEERGKDLTNRDVPGIRSGLIKVMYKRLGETTRKEGSFDTAIFNSLLAIDRQAAIELHQWNVAEPELPWDGDLSTAPTAWLDKWIEYILNIVYKGDKEKIEQARKEYEAKRKKQIQ